MDYLKNGLAQIGAADEKIKIALSKYADEIELFNPRFSLVGKTDKNTIIIRHILDSAAPWNIILQKLNFSNKLQLADIGSGAGFPGIPLSIILPCAEWHLVEKKNKRASFLYSIKYTLNLTNINIDECQAEDIITNNNIFFDAIFCRGFSEIDDKIIMQFFSLLKKNGIIIFYKGKKEKIISEIKNCKKCDNINFEIIPYKTPFLEEERHLVLTRFI